MTTIALLPGTFSQPGDFEQHGFHAAAAARGLRAELVELPLRAAWVADGSIIGRIRGGVNDAREVWLCGISLGALSAMAYAARYESDLAGLVLLSPYPGTRHLEGELEREAWDWLATRPCERLPVHCYYGRDDRFVAGQRRIAALLDAGLVHELPGGHDWAFWRGAWEAFLDARHPVAA